MDHMVPYGHTMNPICAIGEPQVLMWAVWVHILSMWAHIGIMCAYRSRTLDSHKAKCVPISGPDVPLPVHMSSTWEHIGPNAGLYGSTWAPSRPNIDPRGTNWAHTDLVWVCIVPNMNSICGLMGPYAPGVGPYGHIMIMGPYDPTWTHIDHWWVQYGCMGPHRLSFD